MLLHHELRLPDLSISHVRVRVQCRQIQIPTPIPEVGADLPAACRQFGVVEWRPSIGADCRPVAIMELTSADAALLLLTSDMFT